MSAGQPPGKRQLELGCGLASRREVRVWDTGWGGTAGPGMEAQKALWPRWGRGCRLGSSLEMQGRMLQEATEVGAGLRGGTERFSEPG